MAQLFSTASRIVPAWTDVCRALIDPATRGNDMFNAVVEISDPMNFTDADRAVIATVDDTYKNVGKAQPINTVANTIFPQAIYNRHGRPSFYEEYLKVSQQMRVRKQTWGTYVQRMIQPNRNGSYSVEGNQLESLVTKLHAVISKQVPRRTAAYELNVVGYPQTAQNDDDNNDEAIGGDICLYSPDCDKRKYMNMQCLSHISFNLSRDNRLHLTALYRSHYYGERALGNFLGLAKLLKFVADESGAGIGSLACVSSYAKFDAAPFGGLIAARRIIERFPQAANE